MTEVVKVSIAGIAFSVEKEGYQLLEQYLENLGKEYSGNPDGREIIGDIEARIAELILGGQSNDTVVETCTVKDIIDQLGYPEEGSENKGTIPSPETSFPRRLYRSSENRKLGGVCSGLGKYFGVDPVWVRVGMFLPLFFLIIFPAVGFHYLNSFLGSFFGALVLLYLLLWFSIPLAKSPRQILEMNGEAVTATRIRDVSRADSPQPKRSHQRSESVLAEMFTLFGRAVILFMKIILIIIGFAFALSAVSIGAAFFSVLFRGLGGSDFLYYLFEGIHGISPQGLTLLLLFNILVPMALFVYFIIALVFKLRISKPVIWTVMGVWLITLLYCTSIIINNRHIIQDNIEQERWEYRWDVGKRHKRFRFSLEEKNFHDYSLINITTSGYGNNR